MSNTSNGQGRSGGVRFGFTVRSTDDTVSISRPVSREDVDRVRRQIAEWERRSRRREPA